MKNPVLTLLDEDEDVIQAQRSRNSSFERKHEMITPPSSVLGLETMDSRRPSSDARNAIFREAAEAVRSAIAVSKLRIQSKQQQQKVDSLESMLDDLGKKNESLSNLLQKFGWGTCQFATWLQKTDLRNLLKTLIRVHAETLDHAVETIEVERPSSVPPHSENPVRSGTSTPQPQKHVPKAVVRSFGSSGTRMSQRSRAQERYHHTDRFKTVAEQEEEKREEHLHALENELAKAQNMIATLHSKNQTLQDEAQFKENANRKQCEGLHDGLAKLKELIQTLSMRRYNFLEIQFKRHRYEELQMHLQVALERIAELEQQVQAKQVGPGETLDGDAEFRVLCAEQDMQDTQDQELEVQDPKLKLALDKIAELEKKVQLNQPKGEELLIPQSSSGFPTTALAMESPPGSHREPSEEPDSPSMPKVRPHSPRQKSPDPPSGPSSQARWLVSSSKSKHVLEAEPVELAGNVSAGGHLQSEISKVKDELRQLRQQTRGGSVSSKELEAVTRERDQLKQHLQASGLSLPKNETSTQFAQWQAMPQATAGTDSGVPGVARLFAKVEWMKGEVGKRTDQMNGDVAKLKQDLASLQDLTNSAAKGAGHVVGTEVRGRSFSPMSPGPTGTSMSSGAGSFSPMPSNAGGQYPAARNVSPLPGQMVSEGGGFYPTSRSNSPLPSNVPTGGPGVGVPYGGPFGMGTQIASPHFCSPAPMVNMPPGAAVNGQPPLPAPMVNMPPGAALNGQPPLPLPMVGLEGFPNSVFKTHYDICDIPS